MNTFPVCTKMVRPFLRRIVQLAFVLGVTTTTCQAVVLYSQLDNPSGTLTSQEFEAALSTFDAMTADDFLVTGGAWTIDELFVPGSSPIAANGGAVDVAFYFDAAGLPGALHTALANQPFTENGTGDLTVMLSSPVVLAPGTWWLSVVVDMDFNSGSQWFWESRTVQTGSAAAWQNPSDGFGTGCTSWTSKPSCAGLTQGTPDQVFEIRGRIPEPTTVALLGLGIAGFSFARRRLAA